MSEDRVETLPQELDADRDDALDIIAERLRIKGAVKLDDVLLRLKFRRAKPPNS